ncbi:MAG: hypothetical protein IPH95_14405 [Candidatus Promineofilum sp.]|nr:hypothetical protein [Promineifilum sp.]
MLTSIQGIYRDGKVVLSEKPMNVGDETPVIVTFLTLYNVDLESRGISRKQALELRERLATFAEDWDSPEMDAYDHYNADESTS